MNLIVLSDFVSFCWQSFKILNFFFSSESYFVHFRLSISFEIYSHVGCSYIVLEFSLPFVSLFRSIFSFFNMINLKTTLHVVFETMFCVFSFYELYFQIYDTKKFTLFSCNIWLNLFLTYFNARKRFRCNSKPPSSVISPLITLFSGSTNMLACILACITALGNFGAATDPKRISKTIVFPGLVRIFLPNRFSGLSKAPFQEFFISSPSAFNCCFVEGILFALSLLGHGPLTEGCLLLISWP